MTASFGAAVWAGKLEPVAKYLPKSEDEEDDAPPGWAERIEEL